jgi:glycosyltransferase involved in cell wall biosynthesis
VDIAREFPFVKLLTEKKQGVVFARNCGFDAAKSDIIGRIDADSVLMPGWVLYVKKFYSMPEHQNEALTGGGYPRNFPFRKVFSWVWHQVVYRFNGMLMGHYILWGSNMAITKRQWQTVRSEVCEDAMIHEDIDLAIHMHKAGFEITHRPDLIVGAYLRRWLDADRRAFLDNLMMWPNTLKKHGQSGWVGGWIGAYTLYIMSFPIWLVAQQLTRR